MVGLFSEQASGFLLVVALVALITLGVPMMIAPLSWAGRLRWPMPDTVEGRNLSIYFGRCLGAVICVQATVVLFHRTEADVQALLFTILFGNFALMIAVHLWGALRGIQPLSETLETVVWVGLLVLALMFWPT